MEVTTKETSAETQVEKINPLDHEGLVCYFAGKYRGRGVEIKDLIQEGWFGLLRACELFDPKLGTKFSTYAGHWIKHYLRTAIRDKGSLIRVPAYLHQAIRNGLTPDSPGLSQGRKDRIRSANVIFNSTVVRDHNSGGGSVDWIAQDERTASTEHDLIESVLETLGKLTRRDQEILKMRFGLDGSRPMTLLEIGNKLGVTRERIRQLEMKSLKRIRMYHNTDPRNHHCRIENESDSPRNRNQRRKPVQSAARDEPKGNCPKCGNPYGKRRRCYFCVNGSHPRKTGTTSGRQPKTKNL